MVTKLAYIIRALAQPTLSKLLQLISITKIGKRTLKGTVNHKMRSLMRFFIQFTDHKKH